MHYQSDGTQVSQRPTPAAVTGTPGYVTSGDLVGGIRPSDDDPDLMNAIMDELCGVVTAAGLTLDKTNNAQLLAALQIIFTRTILVFSYSGLQGSIPTGWSVSGSNGSFLITPPKWKTQLKSRLWGGGGGGGGVAPGPGASSGGSGGGYSEGVYSIAPSSVLQLTVGAAGAPGTAGPTAGGYGGTTTLSIQGFGSLHSATGGKGGLAASSGIALTPGSPGYGLAGALNLQGSSGAIGFLGGASAYYGGAGGAAFGCGPGDSTDANGSGTAGNFPGQGGDGTASPGSVGYAGGQGYAGLAILEA